MELNTEKDQNKQENELPVSQTPSETNTEGADTSDITTDSNDTVTSASSDPEMDAFLKLDDQEKLWFFIDDMVPTENHDTEVIPYQDGSFINGHPSIRLIPKSMDIFEEIAMAPNHAASSYPELTKYFSEIIRLYNTIVKEDVNPYWRCEPIQVATPQTVAILLALANNQYRGLLSRKPKPDSIPCRLHYGDDSHKHDFVGIVYLRVEKI